MSFLDDARARDLWTKIKAGLSGKQPTLTGTAGQVVEFGADGAAVAVRGWDNTNLLDNWYFPDPIIQMGKTEYNGKGCTNGRTFQSLNYQILLSILLFHYQRT